MLCFRVFVRIHSRRSLDSFLDLNPILCPRFLNSFPCHTSKITLLNPVLATLRKNSKITPFFATHPPPGGLLISVQHTCQVHPAAERDAVVLSHSPISAYPLSSFFSHSCALFCIFLHFLALAKNPTLLFPIDSALFAKNTGVGAHAYSNGQTQPIANAWRELSSTDHRTRNAEHELPVTAIPGAAVLSFGRNLELTTHD